MKFDLEIPFLLAASPHIKDPYFQKAVILVADFDSSGAMGFVINCRSHMMLSEVVYCESLDVPPQIPVWNAGPIDSSSGFILHSYKTCEYERELAPGICLSASQETLLHMIQVIKDSKPENIDAEILLSYRLLIGYAGWGAGQLEEEIKAGAWISAPADRDIIFHTAYQHIWARTMRKIGIINVDRLANFDRGYSH